MILRDTQKSRAFWSDLVLVGNFILVSFQHCPTIDSTSARERQISTTKIKASARSGLYSRHQVCTRKPYNTIWTATRSSTITHDYQADHTQPYALIIIFCHFLFHLFYWSQQRQVCRVSCATKGRSAISSELLSQHSLVSCSRAPSSQAINCPSLSLISPFLFHTPFSVCRVTGALATSVALVLFWRGEHSSCFAHGGKAASCSFYSPFWRQSRQASLSTVGVPLTDRQEVMAWPAFRALHTWWNSA